MSHRIQNRYSKYREDSVKKIVSFALCVLVFAVLLGGCATNEFVLKSPNLPVSQDIRPEKSKGIDMIIEPYESLGVIETDAVRRGDVTAFWGVFPNKLFGEFFPGRIRWNAWVVDKDGTEHFAQAILSGVAYSGNFAVQIIVDGKVSPDAKIANLSTAVDYIYDLSGQEYPTVRRRFLDETKYRQEEILKNGSRVGDMKSTTKILETIRKWNRYETPKGVLLSPIGEKELKVVAGINPQYSFSEKLVARGHFSLVADATGVLIGLAVDMITAGNAPTSGWDYNSQLPNRRNMAFIIDFVMKHQQYLISELNQANIQLYKKTSGGRK
jgi:hypothetical protein